MKSTILKWLIKVLVYIIFSFWSAFLPSFLLRSGIVRIDYNILYIIIYVLYVITLLLMDRIILVRKNAMLLTVPILLLTLYGLWINYEDLFPVVIPTVTILFFLALLPFIFIAHQRKIILVSLFVLTAYSFFLFPKMWMTSSVKEGSIASVNVDSFKFKDINGADFLLEQKGAFIVDCMFLSCRPCIDKLPYLKQLDKHFDSVFIVVDGNIDSYEDFKKFYDDNPKLLEGSKFLYDTNGDFMKAYQVKAYPVEFIFNHGRVVAHEEGFVHYGADQYVQSRLKLMQH